MLYIMTVYFNVESKIKASFKFIVRLKYIQIYFIHRGMDGFRLPRTANSAVFFLSCYFLRKKSRVLLHFLEGWLGSETLGCFRCLDYAVNLSWIEAHQQCEHIGGFLAEPRTGR